MELKTFYSIIFTTGQLPVTSLIYLAFMIFLIFFFPLIVLNLMYTSCVPGLHLCAFLMNFRALIKYNHRAKCKPS